MATFIFKSEPEDYSLSDLERAGAVRWDCIRNYGARNRLRQCVPGDVVLFYHSGKSPGVVGTATVSSEPYPDPTQFDESSDYFDPKAKEDNPRWTSVDIEFESRWESSVTLAAMKAEPRLAELEVVTHQRLSVTVVTEEQLAVILSMR